MNQMNQVDSKVAFGSAVQTALFERIDSMKWISMFISIDLASRVRIALFNWKGNQ